MIKNKNLLAFVVSLFLSQIMTQGVFADTNYRVKSSDNLNKIAEKHYEDSGLTKSQIMVGIYASNPNSFKNGNINKLLRGQKLVLPDADKINQISDHEAELVLSARKKRTLKKRRIKKRSKAKKRKSKPRKKLRTRKLAVSQAKDVKKINKLEKESESLRKRLDLLLAEKSARDNKLKELENSLQAALKKTAMAASTASAVVSDDKKANVEPDKQVQINKVKSSAGAVKQTTSESELVTKRANEKLRETNELLEKNLQESKNEIAKRTRDSLAKEHAIKTSQTSNTTEVSNTFDTSNKYLQWALLSLLLLPLVWFAKRFIGAKKVKQQPAWVSESENPSAVIGAGNEQIDTHYQEAPVESSIKLDVASAYLESGNTDEAMEILNEILLEGNPEQKSQAQDLLDRYS
jgi:FimV-like protein